MFSSVRNIIISAVMALLLIGSSVAAATGFEAFSFSSSEPSVDDSPSLSSSSDSLSDVSGSDSSSDDISTSSSSSSGDDDSSGNSQNSSSDSSTDSSSSSSSDDSASSSSTSADDASSTEPVTYDVAEVGTVTVAQGDGLLHVTDTTLAEGMEAAGWSVVIERADAIEVEVSFRGLGRVDFKAEIEHGEVRIRVRDRRLEDSGSGSSNSGSSNSDDSSNSSHSSGSNSDGSHSSGQSDSEVTQTSPASTDTRTANGVGGTVIVESTGTELSLTTATPNTGWSMDVRDSGPARVDVRFEKGNSETHIRFEISGGTVTVKVEERA